jgi:hypothetical protein
MEVNLNELMTPEMKAICDDFWKYSNGDNRKLIEKYNNIDQLEQALSYFSDNSGERFYAAINIRFNKLKEKKTSKEMFIRQSVFYFLGVISGLVIALANKAYLQ